MNTKDKKSAERLTAELEELRGRLHAAEEEIRRLRTSDPVTGAGNRRLWDDALSAELLRIKRYGGCLSIIVAELDGHIEVTERRGHAGSDKLLCEFVEMITSSTRKTDSVYRLGDAKFSVLMPQTRLAGADMIADRMRTLLEESTKARAQEKVTSSFGVAEFKDGEGGISLMMRADDALFRARQAGGNRVITA